MVSTISTMTLASDALGMQLLVSILNNKVVPTIVINCSKRLQCPSLEELYSGAGI